LGAGPAGDGRDDADLVARLHLGREPLEEADVLFADVDVDEAADPLGVEEAVLDPRVTLLEIVDHLADRGAGRGDLVGAAGQRPERRGDSYRRAHAHSSWW